MSYADDLHEEIQVGVLVIQYTATTPNQPRGPWCQGEVTDRLGDTVFVRWTGETEAVAVPVSELTLDSAF